MSRPRLELTDRERRSDQKRKEEMTRKKMIQASGKWREVGGE